MPQKVLPTKKAFFAFFEYLEKLGFRRMTNEEIKEELNEKTTISTIVHNEVGYGIRRQYLFQIDTIRCEVNTNYSDALGGAYPEGYGKVTVKDNRSKSKLMSFDVRLGEKFLRTLYKYARAYTDFIKNWPYTTNGERRLFLMPIEGVMYEKFFVFNYKRQEGIYFLDIPMEDINKKFLQEMLDRRKNLTNWEEKNNINRKPLPVLRKEKQIKKAGEISGQAGSVKN